MVDKPKMDPNSPPPSQPTGSQKAQPKGAFNAPDSGQKGGWAKPMHWMGMDFTAEQAKQLWNIITQTISTQIKKDQDKAIKALRKLRSDDGGQDDDS